MLQIQIERMDWIKKHKDRVLAASILLFFVLLVAFSSLFFSGKKNEESDTQVADEVTQIDISTPQETAKEDSAKPSPKSTSFFLRPTANELLEQLSDLKYHEFKKEMKELPGLRVMWPAYFFSSEMTDPTHIKLILDTSEDGFGVVLVTEINTGEHPEIVSLEKGQKIWLAAEIIGVDPTGTGQILLATEHIRLGDYDPQQDYMQNLKTNMQNN